LSKQNNKPYSQPPLPGLEFLVRDATLLSPASLKDKEESPPSPPPGSGFQGKAGPGRGHKKRSNTNDVVLDRWNEKASAGFWNFIEDMEPHVLMNNRWVPFQPTDKQREIINSALAVDNRGRFKHQISLAIQPRRFGKSTAWLIIIGWLFCSRENHTTQLLGVSELHTRRTQFNRIADIIRNSPKLSRLISEDNIRSVDIVFPARNNIIQMSAGSSTATAYGDRLDLLYLADFHNFVDLQPWLSFQSALLDSSSSIILIDSNVGAIDSHDHELQQEAQRDESIYCDHLFFKDIEDYCKKAPDIAPWINTQKARRQERTSLPADFRRDILGQRSDSKNALFPSHIINLCKSKYKIPVSDVSELAKGRAYKVGGALDRSKSLFGGDATVWSTILKVASPEHGEPEFFLLSQQVIIPNTSRMIKKAILKDHERYNLDNVVLENYEVTDLKAWLDDQRISNELVSATDTAQNSSFPEFHRIAKEGRFHFPALCRGLAKEMSTFVYIQRTGGKYSFGHASTRFHDDRVYSVNWAIFSLRQAILNLYVLGHVVCTLKSAKRHSCFLMSGGLQLLCSEGCQTYKEVEGMFKEFKQHQLDSELSLTEFYESKVKLEGARISQAA
jgi:hypothetical protein